MKKSILILTLLTTMLILSACGGSASEAESAATQLTSTGEDDLSVEVQLALGTVKLDEGENAIDAAQHAPAHEIATNKAEADGDRAAHCAPQIKICRIISCRHGIVTGRSQSGNQ